MTNKIVLYVSKVYPCKIGGMEIYNYHLVNELARSQDFERITILSSCKEIGGNTLNILPEKQRGFLIRRYGLGTASTILYYLLSGKIRWREVKVIYLPYTSNFSYNAFPFLMLKKFLKVDYVVHIHSGGLRESKPSWLFKKFFRNALNIAGVSYPIVEEYTMKTGRKVKYLPPLLPFQESTNDKETLKRATGFDEFEKIILFVGTIKELKSPETLLKAYEHLGHDFISQQKLGLVIVGDGPLRIHLENKYANIESIIFKGAVPNEEVKNYYKMADIYTITSWFEGTSISLLEAMFNRLPCIGTNVTGIREIILPGETGYLFEKDDHEELAVKIKEIITNYSNALSMGNNAYEHYHKKFNYANHLSEISEFIGV